MILKGRNMRMSDLEWLIFQDMGGADWLRKYLKAKAKLPLKHYEAQLKGAENDTGKESQN
jgi:hypothetical protein